MAQSRAKAFRKPELRRTVLFASVIGSMVGVCLLAASGPAQAQSFEGFTVIDLADEDGRNAIRGTGDIGPTYRGRLIVTFVSPEGTYASLQDLPSDRMCVAWAASGSRSGGTITFGLPASIASQTAVSPKICQPFTLTYRGPGQVQVTARNKFEKWKGPLSPEAYEVSYSEVRPVIAHVPLHKLNWRQDQFRRHDVKGVTLGPLAAVQEALKSRAQLTLGPLERSSSAVRRKFEATFAQGPGQSGRTSYYRVYGYSAPGKALGQAEDALYAAWYSENFEQQSTSEGFDAAIAERYGATGLRWPGTAAGTRRLVWLYDLDGRQLKGDDAPSTNCLAMADYWRHQAALDSFNYDIGPWGCALVVTVTHDGAAGRVGSYKVEAIGGYALGLSHFALRLHEMHDAQLKIRQLESSKPKL